MAATSSLPFAPQERGRKQLPPVVLVEGEGNPNGLSVVRALGRRGIKVYAITPPKSYVRYSRYCTWIPDTVTGGESPDERARYLLGPESAWLRGAVLLTCYDQGLQLLARFREPLAKKYRLDLCVPAAQLCMLDKLATYQAAAAAGVPTPRFWVARDRGQAMSYRDELVYPLLVKPLLSHIYRGRFWVKFAVANNFEEMLGSFDQAAQAGIDVMLVEQIPGPDDRLCSYYTYLDERGNALFDFTKRIIRRFPLLHGPGCHHITDWVPELKEPALKLFRQVGLQGLANVEFKRDDRDGVLKLIECNARITAANRLVAHSGIDLASFVYNRIVGLPQPPLKKFKLGKRLLFPIEDFHAYRALRARGELTFWQWLKSIAHPVILPIFQWSDPSPTLVFETERRCNALGRRLKRWFARLLPRINRSSPPSRPEATAAPERLAQQSGAS
ncbi:MAG: carboxylate--amine ligase [Planctomycetes bacterium]|nr:carboxylate--amine ligase [Planctomycetota bacterium]